MFAFDPEMTELIFDYCRWRLAEDPVSLDFIGRAPELAAALDGLLTAQGTAPEIVLERFRGEIARAVISIDCPRNLAFIPAAPTKAAALIEDHDAVELVREPGLSIVLFRRPGWSDADYAAWSTRLLAEQIAFVTPTTFDGEMIARFCFLHPAATPELISEILDTTR